MILVYGVTGYTGRLVVEELARRGETAVLAGRDPARVGALAEPYGFAHRAFGLDAVDLSGIRVVLHCAGPFVRTSRPMVDACLAAGAHYLDITGEISVFEAVAARDAEATERGVMLLPGAGYDVVPSDCLAVHVARRLPGAESLTLAMVTRGSLSHGTASTMLLHAGGGGTVRRGGKLVGVPWGHDVREVDFGDKRRHVSCIPWGDVATAWYSTGIPDIAVYARVPRAPAWVLRAGAAALSWGPVHRLAQARLDAAAPGPDPETRTAGWARIVGEVRRGSERARSLLVTPEGYTLTARTAVDLALRARTGATPGFQTPGRWQGPDYILGFEGVHREDLPD